MPMPRAPAHIHERADRGEVIPFAQFLRGRHGRHIEASKERFYGLGGRLGKIDVRLGRARPNGDSGVELEGPLGSEVGVHGAQIGGPSLHQEVLSFGGIGEAALLHHEEVCGD